jgi:hypothetical protein
MMAILNHQWVKGFTYRPTETGNAIPSTFSFRSVMWSSEGGTHPSHALEVRANPIQSVDINISFAFTLVVVVYT